MNQCASWLRNLAKLLWIVVCTSGGGSGVLAADPFPIDTADSCVNSSCHAETATRAFAHEAASDGYLCTTCHDVIEEGLHSFELVFEGRELCAMCHDESLFTGEVVHGPVADGRCTSCHNPHSSDFERLLRAEEPDLCFQCHNRSLRDHDGLVLSPVDAVFEDPAMTLHPPFATGLCGTCHLPHASDHARLLDGPYPKGLYATFAADKYFCFNCHDETAFTTPRTLQDTAFRNGNLNLHYRHVNKQKGRSCKACHFPHGTANESLIRDEVPFGRSKIVISEFTKTQTGGSCAPNCHRKVAYDRVEPVLSGMRVTPREGEDATPEELGAAGQEQLGQ